MTVSRRTVVTGGVRSGKSAYAERLLEAASSVTYIAPGPMPDPDDADWSARVAAHQSRRPSHWRTVETADAAQAIADADGAVLLDCVGTWVTSMLDDIGAWDQPQEAWIGEVARRLDALATAWSSGTGRLVAVTNEVGMGVHPEFRSGRVFRDVLGLANQRLAAVSDDVVLLVAGRPLRL
ncbi:MAG: bifunctional adenosylcobinamide kinase/adenosylcobinamide-phosphate guanylyltransferase [Nocardioidaceae bacterium]